jgi:hypothetical protein
MKRGWKLGREVVWRGRRPEKEAKKVTTKSWEREVEEESEDLGETWDCPYTNQVYYTL